MRTAFSRKRTKPGSPRLTDTSNTEDEESLLQPGPYSKLRHGNSAGRAKLLLNKICLITDGDNHACRKGFIGLLQDLVAGIVLGTLGMIVLLLLDYSNVINLETARVFRKTASGIINTPEIMESIELEIEKKLVSIDVYNAMNKELSDSQAAIEENEQIIGARVIKATSFSAELVSLREEYNKLMKEIGLDVFCADCQWGMGMNCQKRVDYLLENYSDTATTIGIIEKLVNEGKTKNGKCLKT